MFPSFTCDFGAIQLLYDVQGELGLYIGNAGRMTQPRVNLKTAWWN